MRGQATPYLLIVGLAGALAVGAAGAGTGRASCGSLTLGPGALTHRTGSGAVCLLRAYEDHCRPAGYRLSVFGVDTVSVRDFRVLPRNGRCEIEVAGSFRVVPQPAHPATSGYCRNLRRQGPDILATACKGGGLPSTVSLTSSR